MRPAIYCGCLRQLSLVAEPETGVTLTNGRRTLRSSLLVIFDSVGGPMSTFRWASLPAPLLSALTFVIALKMITGIASAATLAHPEWTASYWLAVTDYF